jgi:DNA-binding transcriptional MocR family regulator
VLYVPGQFCYVNGVNGPLPTHEARLSFGVAAPAQLREGVRRLASAYCGLYQPEPATAEV